jgi:hypothetical protein
VTLVPVVGAVEVAFVLMFELTAVFATAFAGRFIGSGRLLSVIVVPHPAAAIAINEMSAVFFIA